MKLVILVICIFSLLSCARQSKTEKLNSIEAGVCRNQCDNEFEIHKDSSRHRSCLRKCEAPTQSTGGGAAVMIQSCQIESLYNLGYSGSGNKHQHCLNNGWNGGEVNSYCWKFTSTPSQDCPRLNLYYQTRNCEHLNTNDATLLHVCGH